MSFTGKRLISAAPTGGLIGAATLEIPTYPATGTWTVPDGVYSISVLTVDAGSNGASGYSGSASEPGEGGQGGARGLVYLQNDMAVTPGQSIEYRVGAPSANTNLRKSIFGSTSTLPAGFSLLIIPGVTAGENGGPGELGTYKSGFGGRATTGISMTTPASTSVSLTGTQNPGTTSGSGVGAAGRKSLDDYGSGGGGGGGAARLDGALGGAGGEGRRGAIRIVWPGESRQYPYDAA